MKLPVLKSNQNVNISNFCENAFKYCVSKKNFFEYMDVPKLEYEYFTWTLNKNHEENVRWELYKNDWYWFK